MLTLPEAEIGDTYTGPPPPSHGTAQKEEEAARIDPSREVKSGERLKVGFVSFVATPNTCRSCIVQDVVGWGRVGYNGVGKC